MKVVESAIKQIYQVWYGCDSKFWRSISDKKKSMSYIDIYQQQTQGIIIIIIDCLFFVLASMPSAMANQIDTFSTQNKLLYILSGLQGRYVREWDDIYRNIARFVHRMYLTRYQLYNSISSNNIWDLLNPWFLQMSCASVYIHELY